MWYSPWRLTPCQSQPYSLWMHLGQMRPHCGWHHSHCPDHQYSSKFPQQYHHQDQQWPWLDWKGTGRFLSLVVQELGLASSTNSGVSYSPCVDLWLLLTLTSWELTGICLLCWSLRVLLEEQSHFFCMGPALNPSKWVPTEGVPIKGISRKGGTGRGGVPVWTSWTVWGVQGLWALWLRVQW